MKKRKLIVVMIDGLSADYFLDNRDRLPSLAALVEDGFSVMRLSSPVPATSMPGRTSIITGVPAAEHSIFGNYVLGEAGFRVASPSDIQVPTIARQAQEAGRDVAGIGYAMLPPEDCDVFFPPWWLRSWIRGSRFEKESMTRYAGRQLAVTDPADRLPAILSKLPKADPGTQHPELEKTVIGMLTDQVMVSAASALACSERSPDLIFTEIATTDTIQHLYGYENEVSHWSLMEADMIIGALRTRLERAGRRDEYVLAVLSDHGHSSIQTAIYPEIVIPELVWQSEGATLHVRLSEQIGKNEIVRRLSEYGGTELDNSYIPSSLRHRVAAFAAPPNHSFEERPVHSTSNAPTGAPRYKSSHGLRPGSAGDDRFCAIAGPGVPKRSVPTALAEQLAPTLLRVLDLSSRECACEALF
jgi:predicted AlkP superfamily pyrophosphatase or phosphodiesterase